MNKPESDLCLDLLGVDVDACVSTAQKGAARLTRSPSVAFLQKLATQLPDDSGRAKVLVAILSMHPLDQVDQAIAILELFPRSYPDTLVPLIFRSLILTSQELFRVLEAFPHPEWRIMAMETLRHRIHISGISCHDFWILSETLVSDPELRVMLFKHLHPYLVFTPASEPDLELILDAVPKRMEMISCFKSIPGIQVHGLSRTFVQHAIHRIRAPEQKLEAWSHLVSLSLGCARTLPLDWIRETFASHEDLVPRALTILQTEKGCFAEEQKEPIPPGEEEEQGVTRSSSGRVIRRPARPGLVSWDAEKKKLKQNKKFDQDEKHAPKEDETKISEPAPKRPKVDKGPSMKIRVNGILVDLAYLAIGESTTRQIKKHEWKFTRTAEHEVRIQGEGVYTTGTVKNSHLYIVIHDKDLTS